ncbi:MAG: hypothetical protein R3D66_06725 [Alphaproteobacteria bacterium]
MPVIDIVETVLVQYLALLPLRAGAAIAPFAAHCGRLNQGVAQRP